MLSGKGNSRETMHRINSIRLLTCIGVLLPFQAFAVNPPHWEEFAKGQYIDSGNVKAEGNSIVSAYVKHADAGTQQVTLFEVDCKNDLIRVHSDAQRYRRVPVEGGGTVVQADDGFRTVVPGSRNAQIETAICGAADRAEAEKAKQRQQVECEQAKHDDGLRVLLVKEKLSQDETMCLQGLTHGERYAECQKAGIPAGTNVVEYLRNNGIFLACESAAGKR
jgi:hypothetical protein